MFAILLVCVCVGIFCVGAFMRVLRLHLHKCRNSQNTNPKKTFVTFSETFYTICGRGLVGAGFDHTTIEAGQKSQVVLVCACACVCALM